ncbi:MAG: ArsR/SmtB family transcription factor [Polyangiaceae bacterium]|jgi:DNA-binding transcriptional ArsR family regulator
MEEIVEVAQALACATRLEILRLLGDDGLSLSDVAREACVAPATAYHHLAVLVQAGLAVRVRQGSRCIYRWSPSRWQLVRMSPPAPSPTT